MKINLRIVLALWYAIFYSLITYSQQNVARPIENHWKPVKIHDNGSNTFNGVEFLKKNEGCNSEDLIILKLVNQNNHSVEVKWTNKDGSKSTINLNASSEIEGSCSSYILKQKTGQGALAIPKSDIKKEDGYKQKWLLSLEVVETSRNKK